MGFGAISGTTKSKQYVIVCSRIEALLTFYHRRAVGNDYILPSNSVKTRKTVRPSDGKKKDAYSTALLQQNLVMQDRLAYLEACIMPMDWNFAGTVAVAQWALEQTVESRRKNNFEQMRKLLSLLHERTADMCHESGDQPRLDILNMVGEIQKNPKDFIKKLKDTDKDTEA